MKKALAICLAFCVMVSCILPISATADASGTTYYVSPSGSDENPGTEAQPWKTLYYAASMLTAGDTAIFEDGLYEETEYTIVANSGEEGQPITFKARNPHKAVIYYDASCRTRQKFRIVDKSYINVRDFYFTQESRAESYDNGPTSDIFISMTGSSYCEITGNKMVKAYEEGIKAYLCSYLTVSDNEIYDMFHEGIDFFSVASSVVRNNKVINFGRDAYMIKGNSANCLIYSNYAHNNKIVTTGNAFDIGGSSNGSSPLSTKENIGYENYNSVFYNNIVYAVDIDGKPSIEAGLSFLGAKDCHCYNNTIVGTAYGIRFQVPSDTDWEWFPNSINPVVQNNLMVNVANAYSDNSGGTFNKPKPENLTRDYNLFYNCGYSSKYLLTDETNSIITDSSKTDINDIFLAYGSDWRIKADSAAVGAGTPFPASVVGFAGFNASDITNTSASNYPDYEYDTSRTVTLDVVDYRGATRTKPWDIGAYAIGNCIADVYVEQGAACIMPGGYAWTSRATTTNIGEQIVTGTSSSGAVVSCRVRVGKDGVYVAEEIKNVKVYDSLLVGDGGIKNTVVPLLMSDGTVKDFTVSYSCSANQKGTYKVSGVIAGFTEKIPVVVTVSEKETEKSIDTYTGAYVILDDGTIVDTSLVGCQYHDVAMENELIHYSVYVGEFVKKASEGMDYSEGTIPDSIGSGDEGDYYLSVDTEYRNNESVKILKSENNSFLSIGPEKIYHGVKTIFNNPPSGMSQMSVKLKFTNLTEHISETEINTVPYHVQALDANNKIVADLYFRLYFNANGFNRMVAGPHLSTGTYPKKEVILKNAEGGDLVTFTGNEGEAKVGESDWITVSFIFRSEKVFDVYVNDMCIIRDQSFYYSKTGVISGDFPIAQLSVRKRLLDDDSTSAVKNDLTACVYADDIEIYEYSKIAEDLGGTPEIALAKGSQDTEAPIYFKMSDGRLKSFDAQISAVDTSKTAIVPTKGTVTGINKVIGLKAVICNYIANGISLADASGNEVAEPQNGGMLTNVQIRKLAEHDNASMLVAFYNKDACLLAFKKVSLANLAEGENTIPMQMTLPDSGVDSDGYFKVFIWEYDKIQPVDIMKEFK